MDEQRTIQKATSENEVPGTETGSGLSRRNFLKGAGIGALSVAGAAGVGALAGCAPQTATTTTGDAGASGTAAASDLALSPAGASYPWPAEPPEIAEADVESEIDCDVVVVGLGVAGCAAFRSAAEGGAKVVAFEKAATPQQRSSQYAYLNGPHSELWGLQTFSDAELMEIIEGEVKEQNYMVKQDIWVRWARESAEAIEWYCNGVPGFNFEPSPMSMEAPAEGAEAEPAAPGIGGGPPADPTTDYSEDRNAYNITLFFSDHQAMLDGQVSTAEGLGAEAYFGHFTEKLIMEGGRCVGAYARNAETGKYVKANASKGVIMTCGDYFSNEDMVRFFRPDLIENGNGNPWPNFDVEGKPTNTGDGYKLGYWAGASLQQHHAPMTHIMGGTGGITETHGTSMGVMGAAPYLRLNWHGERFMNEDISNVNDEYQVDIQPRRQYLMFFDSKYGEYPELAGLMAASQESIDEAIEAGKCFKGETLDELLDNIKGLDGAAGYSSEAKATALKSIQRYNELVAKGTDEDFNKLSKYLKPLESGPFYAQLTGTALCLVVIGGGLESDKEAHVLDLERAIIPGLYAGGNIQGNRFAIKYPFKLGGASHCMAMFYGYIAGQNAAQGV
ncbi:MAG: FAD-binding protein [Coriobacteriales bacterium]|jgi:succinate dehydrogenase/fumarate reductase flavoprotein subunit|nr:FAD-binding protein [Coriobacteriales bacterium]